MKLTPALIEERMRQHRAWQDQEAERLANELWTEILGTTAGPALPTLKGVGLSKATLDILNELGR